MFVQVVNKKNEKEKKKKNGLWQQYYIVNFKKKIQIEANQWSQSSKSPI